MGADRGPITSTITIIITAISTAFVAARFFTRTWIVRSIKQDDWWMLAAWLVSVGFSVSVCVNVRYGLGQHQDELSVSTLSSLRKAEYAFSVLYNPSLMLTKTSILVFYLSVMSKDVDRIFKWCNWLTLLVVNVGGLALTFWTIFPCTPISASYTYPTPDTAKCTDIVTLYLSTAPINIITDIAILLLPMPILTGMRLPKKQKIILVITFSFGAFVAVVDVIRLAYLQNAAEARLRSSQTPGPTLPHHIIDQGDFSWYASLSFMWSAIEVHLGIICACVPSLKPLFLKFLPNFVRDTGDPGMSVHNSIDEGTSPTLTNLSSLKGNTSMLNNPAAFRKPAVKEYAGEDDGDNMGFLNMLAGPDDDAPNLEKTKTRSRTIRRTSTARSTASDFDFVNMSSSKNMLKLSNRQSFWPIAVVTVIFFLWGFAYGLLDTLNAQFQKVVGVDTEHALGLHAAYFAGYLIGPLTLGRFILKSYGFKASMMVGLCVYGCGTLVFWPSAVLTSYTAFVISNFVVASGLSCLEIAANPYIALCGPLEYAEVRLNLSQAFQAVGTVCSSMLANKVMFRHITDASSLSNVQWAYLGIALFVFGLAIAFYYIPLPEASDDELEEMADRRSAAYRARVGPWKVVYVTLALGVLSQFCYVGSQESLGNNTQNFYALVRRNKNLTAFNYQVVGHTVFAASRFISAFLNYLFKPRWILLALYTAFLITFALQMHLDGTGAAANQMMTYFFEAGIFSIIFAISMRGLGAHTKTGSAFMTAAISGGALFPPLQWVAQQSRNLHGLEPLRGLKYSFCVPLAGAVVGILFPIYLNLMPQARNQVDPIHEKRHERRQRKAMARQDSITSEVDAPTRQFGLVGIIARRKKQQRLDKAEFEHVEQKNEFGTPPSSVGTSEKDHEKANISSVPPVVLKGPSGQVGQLQPWPGDDLGAESNSDSSRSQQVEDIITRHRPVWEHTDDDDDSVDDYHATIRKM